MSPIPTGGNFSPGRNHDYVDDAHYTYSDGDVKDDGIVGISFGAIPDSYGNSPNREYIDYGAYYVYPGGNVDYYEWDIMDSYGRNSPDYGNDYVSYYIEDTGYTYTDVWVYTHSYGQFKLSVLHRPRLQGVLCVR